MGFPLIASTRMNPSLARCAKPGPAAFLVPIDPEQTHYPKINSRITATGSMESSPLHLMFPALDPTLGKSVMPHLHDGARQ